jgi:hypothetical protein
MSTRFVIAGAAALALAGSTAGAAFAGAATTHHRAKPTTVSVVARHLAGPLSVAQAPNGTRYWTDDFAGVLYRQAPGGTPTVAYQGTKKAPAEAVSADGGVLRFSTGSNNNKGGKIWTLGPTGAPVQIADTYAYEKAANPDGKVKYGFLDTPKSCLNKVPKQVPAFYKGPKESHPYSTAVANGITYVGDAGGNDVIAISPTGVVSTVAVIKPAKVKVTKSLAKEFGLPSCTLGKKYALESVPTDIEVGPDGNLYVTSLPGGPESDALGLNGRVIRVNPTTGGTKTMVRGLLSPTGLAVAPNGDFYVAQLFKGEISKIRAGKSKVRTYLQVNFPAAVEITPTGLLATVNAVPMGKKPKGQVITITP